MENQLIQEASFNPKVKIYIFLVVAFTLLSTIIGIPILILWLLGLGQWLSKKYYHSLKCRLNSKNLTFSKGIIVHIEKTIPLENIQDLSFLGGPILRSFGLTMIKVETAGGGGQYQTNLMSMIGINDAEQFKNLILAQRETIIKERSQASMNNSDIQNENAIFISMKEELTAIRKLMEEKNN